MARDRLTTWLIGTSVPCRLTVTVNGVKTNADALPTIDLFDSAGLKQEDAQNLTNESTGEYVIYADSSGYPVGKCYYVISYAVSTISIKERSMFFVYDQATWLIIERVRGMLDDLQEGELDSGTIYEHYQYATREITNEASTAADADLLTDAILAQTAYDSYISYLTDRERAGDQIGTAAYIMLTELRLKAERALKKVMRATQTKSEVFKGLFTTTESAMQFTEHRNKDPGAYEASKRQT